MQLRFIRLAVVAILLGIPEHYREGQGMYILCIKIQEHPHDSCDNEETSAPDEEDGEHGEADVPGLPVVATHLPGHVAIGGTEDNQQEVEPLLRKEGGDALMADLEVAVARVHVNEVSLIADILVFC